MVEGCVQQSNDDYWAERKDDLTNRREWISCIGDSATQDDGTSMGQRR